MPPNAEDRRIRARDTRHGTETQSQGLPHPVYSATSLRCELGIGVELQESTILTAEGSDWHTLDKSRFRPGPERLLRLACVPAPDKDSSVGIIRHKPLGHPTFAFWTLHFFHWSTISTVTPPNNPD